MDLFGDLPEPDAQNSKEEPDKLSKRGDLVSDQTANIEANAPLQSTGVAREEDRKGEKRKCEEDGGSQSGKRRSTTAGSHVFPLKGYYAERKGEREDMQDRHVVLDDITRDFPGYEDSIFRLAFYGVFDGHGGARASEYAANHLLENIKSRFQKGDIAKLEGDMKRCFVEAFKQTDDDFLTMASKEKPAWKDGTTAVAVLVLNNTLYIGNLGDSKAVLCRFNCTSKKHTAIPLTKDHNPTHYEERIRIQKAGGHVRDGRVMGVLEVSRSIGDGPYKKHGLSCVPDVKKCQLTQDDRFLLIACDGLWKRFDNESAVDYVKTILKDSLSEDPEENSADPDSEWDTACNKLANEAVLRLSADNVTVVLVNIGKCP